MKYSFSSTVLFTTLFSLFSLFVQGEEAYDDSIDLNTLAQAWTIPTGGSGNQPYYNIQVNGINFVGERSWQDRWDLFKDAIDYKNKRVLELGCNVGLASVYLLKYRGAASSTGVDRPNSELKLYGMTRLMEASQLLQKAFGVHINSIQIDLNNSPYEGIIGFDYDTVMCMSILKWVNDKERFMSYLSNFNDVLFEGHEADEIEIARFKRYGFNRYEILGSTHVGVSYPAEATRTLIHFWKD